MFYGNEKGWIENILFFIIFHFPNTLFFFSAVQYGDPVLATGSEILESESVHIVSPRSFMT